MKTIEVSESRLRTMIKFSVEYCCDSCPLTELKVDCIADPISVEKCTAAVLKWLKGEAKCLRDVRLRQK